MKEPKNVIRETDDEARTLAKRLIRTARFGAIAVNFGDDGFPSVSRVSVATDQSGAPIILVSELSTHTQALLKDQRCSIMLGEPGKGDPLAHPRITIKCEAARIKNDDETRKYLRARFIRRHPKASLYVDFGDFCFFRLNPLSASLNGGFGKAFELTSSDFLISTDGLSDLVEMEDGAIEHMNNDHADFIDKIAARHLSNAGSGWQLISLDAEGVELAHKEQIIRCDFSHKLTTASGLKDALIGLGT